MKFTPWFGLLILFLIQFYPTFKNLFFEKFYSKNKTKVCLCVIAKKENLYIEYFIYYYKQLGFDHIYLYDNNDKNGEKMENTIMDESVLIIEKVTDFPSLNNLIKSFLIL